MIVLSRNLSSLDIVHPALQLACFAAIILFTMVVVHPVFLAVSFIGALAFSIYARGWRSTLRTLRWQLPLVILCALINPLFATVGSTELYRIGVRPIYLESVIYGACMGLMLVAVMLWFYNASLVLSSDKVLAVMGNTLPTIALMISMMMRLVPQFVERGILIGNTAQATSAATPRNAKDRSAARLRQVSVLMGWSMEDSLERSDAMRARGWGGSTIRSTYQRYRFSRFDQIASIFFSLLLIIVVVAIRSALSSFRFYPIISLQGWAIAIIPYTLLMGLPLAMSLIDDLRWRRVA